MLKIKFIVSLSREYADVIYDWYFPSGFFFTAAQMESESRQLSEGQIEYIRHTPTGPISMITKADWRGSGTIKRWVTQPEDVERILLIPYVTSRPDLTGFFETKKRLEGKCVVQVTFADPICTVSRGWSMLR